MEQSINHGAQAMIKNSWENFAKLYDKYIQMNMLQGFTTLAVHTKAHSRKRILEVACGSGLHTLFFAKTMLQRGAVVVSTDISEEMIKLAKNRFEDATNDYLAIEGNKVKISPSEIAPLGTKEWNLEKIL
jgi:ubiquinone/menaquinone biosynthesis C-methylase UbiE